MKIRRIIGVLVIVYIVAIIATVIIIGQKKTVSIDIVAINELVQKIELNWIDIKHGKFESIELQSNIAIIDHDEQVIFQSSGVSFNTLYNAIKDREGIIDLYYQDGMIGKVIVYHNEASILEQMKKQLLTVLIIVFIGLLIISVGYIVVLKSTIFTPFNKLQQFAANIARGNLDTPLQVQTNNPFGAFTESFDIMREELAIARSNEYNANQSKKELVASLSHDIKTPVASIKAISELMLLKVNDDKQQKQLHTIYAKAEQIDFLVTDMFHATLEELQQLRVEVTEQSSNILFEMISKATYDNEIVCDPLPACIILTDELRLQQVFDNILSNAYKYAATPVHITNYINATHLVIEFSDFGEGVNEDELPFIFNKYYRGRNIDGKSGTGLGLFLSQYFMQHMQGDIECCNRGDGFTIMVHIKLA
ncbi:HAMP domain-containing sensor histidine kinase [Paenibacillus endoradicis]|uniref:HAMP domain-containing sensor histidine kinase n=1 Tax=Paenibacillus endoradicis TaxID=2972487 RepID=UPI0021598F97|nr:HAMP domain-containing sensor histidine kinase [Paenibacillus endoradicis]MCR8659911.1 HAMP domain-containing histidine kinase [Paenibacillus endoradicis]